MPRNGFKGARLAPWWMRAVAVICDNGIFNAAFSVVIGSMYLLLGLLAGVSFIAESSSTSDVFDQLGALGVILLLGISFTFILSYSIWNNFVLRGSTGRTLGSRVVYLRLVDERTGRPIGGWSCFLRSLLHVLDYLPLGLGFLLPLVTEKRQTIADLIMHTVVVVDDRPVPPTVGSFRRKRPAPIGPTAPQHARPSWPEPALR